MHQILFCVKRVHLMGLELSRALLRTNPLTLTPARFDMMRIVHVHDLQGVGVPQANIRLVLGVSGATVSRMLKALQAHGYIVRKRVRYMRGLIVHLTDWGRALIKSLVAQLVDSNVIDNELDEMVEPEPKALPAFDKLLRFFRNAYVDPAPFDHPWHCGLSSVPWPARFSLPHVPWATAPNAKRRFVRVA
jgi:DNA-binding MarR family transcriptional regulator